MDSTRPPEVVRERISRLTGGGLSCVLIFDREFSSTEISRFYAVRSDESPYPANFEVEGRVIRYDCPEGDEARWRLAVEIFLVKSFRPAPRRLPPEADVRRRFGLRPLHR